MVVHLVVSLISTCRRRNHVFIKSFTNSTFVLQSILFVIMISDSLSSYRSQIGNHVHLRPRDSKLANKCVYSSIPLFLLKLLHQTGNTPTREIPHQIKQLEIPRYQAEFEKTSQPSSAREYLDQIGNKGSHSTYFFILKQRKPQQWQKI